MKTINLNYKAFRILPVKCAFLLVFAFPIHWRAQSQLYDNFEGNKHVRYGERSGVLDTTAKNPAPNDVNRSTHCALYVRNGSRKFDNIKMGLHHHLSEVDKYATYQGVPPKLKLKVYTSAPPGTLVEILLGSKRGNNDYPAGTHSQYQAYTKVSNQWEELEFLFSQIPQGSETSASQIDQATLLFNPNSTNSDTYYFDDLMGPPQLAAGTTGATGSVEQVQPPKMVDQETEAVNTTQPVSTPAVDKTNKETRIEQGPTGKKTKKKG